MTQAELDAIRSRCDKATPGPWYEDGFAIPNEAGDYTELIDSYPADAAFIAHSREDIPALLAEVDKLKTALIIAAWESEESVYKGTDENEIYERWIKKAEAALEKEAHDANA